MTIIAQYFNDAEYWLDVEPLASDTYVLPSTSALVQRLSQQLGDYAFPRFLRNLGIDFDDAYLFIFGKAPR